MLPDLSELLASAYVVSLPMRVRFRGVTHREALLLRGPAGWGEFAPFLEYDDAESALWLRSAIEAAWVGPPKPVRDRIPVNATVPAVAPAEVAGILARFPGAATAKVKVAEPGQTLADDVARVQAVRRHIPKVRVDANGGWTVEQALAALDALGDLEYAEQPCRSVAELAEVRRRTHVRIAADESIRKGAWETGPRYDPLRVVHAGAADVAVVKVAPLGGMRRVVELADALGVPVVVSSALDTAVGIGAGLAAAAALPHLELACGLGTGGLFESDVAAPRRLVEGTLATAPVEPEPDRLQALSATTDRTDWWLARLRRCYAHLV